jgi:anti-anti-sigma factor
MPHELSTRVRDVPPLVVLDLSGEVTTFAQEPLMRAYREASERGAENILLNLSAVDYLNSAGIAAIIGIISEARKADQRVLLTGLTPHYQTVFDMMGLTTYAPLFESEEAARVAVASA